MTEAVQASLFTHPFKPIVHGTHLQPTKVIIREVDFEQDGGRLRFFFSKGATVELPGPAHGFKEIVNQVCDGSFRFPPGQPPLDHPYDSPLSLQNDELAYVIYRLSQKEWQFAQRLWPITVSTQAKRDYFMARRADRHGYDQADDGDDETNLRQECHVAFFIADGRPRNGKREFKDAINLHVDLIYRDLDKTRHLPIIIDPDVRYPGGSNDP